MLQLINHIEKITNAEIESSPAWQACFKPLTFQKREHLFSEGQMCRSFYFIKRGVIRLYFVDDLAIEQTIQLAIDNWWITDLAAFGAGVTSGFYLQALETTEVFVISQNHYQLLLEQNPIFEKYFRRIFERAYAASLMRMRYLRLPKEKFYDTFESKYPEIIQRVPQKYLASFLGFTPEYLSELRRKKRDNEYK